MNTERRTAWRHFLKCRCNRIGAYLRRYARLVLWFAGGLAGVLAKGLFEAIRARQPCRLAWTDIVLSAIATLIVLRATYKQHEAVCWDLPLVVQVSIAFLAGFAW